MGRSFATAFRRHLDGLYNLLIPGTTAEIAADRFPDIVSRGVGVFVQQRLARDQHAGRAVSALQGMVSGKCRSQCLHDRVAVVTFDGAYMRPSAGGGEGDAAAYGNAVELHRTRPAHAVFAAEVSTREVVRFPQVIGEMGPGLNLAVNRFVVDRELQVL